MPGPGTTGSSGGISPAADGGARRTSRSHKRKKFDDEILGDVNKKDKTSSSAKKKKEGEMILPLDMSAKLKRTKLGKNILSDKPVIKMTPWPARDDYKLIVNVQQVPDLVVVHCGVKFSRKYSLHELKERWYALMYDQDTCRRSCAAIAALDEEERRLQTSTVLFSAAEENHLRSIQPGVRMPTEDQFRTLMDKHPDSFCWVRTPRHLFQHWTRMYHFGLLRVDPSCGRLGRMLPQAPRAASACDKLETESRETGLGGNVASGSVGISNASASTVLVGKEVSIVDGCTAPTRVGTAESRDKTTFAMWRQAGTGMVIPYDLAEPTVGGFESVCREIISRNAIMTDVQEDAIAKQLDKELEGIDRKHKRKIRKLERQINLWKSVPELGFSPLNFTSAIFDDSTLAILRGVKIDFRMKSQQIVAGRQAEGNIVDVDLTVEEPATRVSRVQFIIKLKHDRHFYLTNLGRRPTYVNGQPVLRGARCRVFTNSMIEICSIAMLFTVNDKLMSGLRAEI
eukprot:m.378648 g.378648  ORF g.378648 m.378648 type:complete len:512 (+) comp20935_c0_seq3:378-1913(+)